MCIRYTSGRTGHCCPLARCLSCGTWVPTKSDSNSCQCNHLCFAQQFSLLLLLRSTKLIVLRCDLVGVASPNDDTDVFTSAFVAMAVADRPASSQVLWRFCDDEGLQLVQSNLPWVLWRLHDRQRLWPSHLLWQGARHCLAWLTRP